MGCLSTTYLSAGKAPEIWDLNQIIMILPGGATGIDYKEGTD